MNDLNAKLWTVADEIKRLGSLDPDMPIVTDTWSLAEVHERAYEMERPELTDDEARAILLLMQQCLDRNYGVNWDTVDALTDQVVGCNSFTASDDDDDDDF